MSMIKCKECGTDVSSKAESCPKCGAPISPKKSVKVKKKTSLLTWLIVVLIGLWFLGTIIDGYETQKLAHQEAERIEQQKKSIAEANRKNVEYFAQNSEAVLASIKSEIDAGNYDKASAITSKYLTTNNSELLGLHKLARTKTVLDQLKAIPAKEYVRNKNLYQELVVLNPDNETYKAKVAHYTKKQAEKEAKEKAAEARKKKIESSFSGWDGSHRGLETYIKNSMDDPDSYEHVETRYGDKGSYLIVVTTFRGKNKFGGVVKQTVSAKVSLDGQVLQIL